MNGWRVAISLTALALTAVGLAGCTAWGTGDEEPPAELTDFDETVRVKRVWSHKLGNTDEEQRLGLTIATDGARVYAAAQDGRVSAFDAVTGKALWKTDTDLPLAAGPSFGDELVVVGSSDGDVAALDARDGSVRWTVPVSSEVLASPAVAFGVVVVRTVDGRVRGLEADDGRERWQIDEPPPRLTLRGNSAPAISGDVVVSGFDDGKVAAISLTEGVVAWQTALGGQRGRTELERLGDVDAGIRIVGDDLYVAGYQSRVAMMAIESGQLLWSRDMSSARTPGVDWDKIYVADASGEVTALDRTNGVPAWQQGAFLRRDITGPVPYRRAVVVGDLEGYLHWLSPEDGAIIGRERVGGTAIAAEPLVVGDLLFALTADGELIAVSAEEK
ncbi:MAG: outer membrane protein assembly factor BamB [Pseudomonadota bacterium]